VILLDTNVISELVRPEPDRRVIAWIDAQSSATLYLSVTVLGELRYGIERLPPGQRRTAIEAFYVDLKSVHFRGRILALDVAAIELAASFRARRVSLGRPVYLADCEVAGTAAAHGFALATRNVDDFDGLGLTLLNPFEISA